MKLNLKAKRTKVIKNIRNVIIAISCVISLTACGDSSNEIVGQWQQDGSSYFSRLEFFSDGTYTSNKSNYKGNYSIDGDRLKLDGYLVDDKVYTYEIDGNKLKLWKGNSLNSEFKRVE